MATSAILPRTELLLKAPPSAQGTPANWKHIEEESSEGED